jgi:hypothetical protein
MNSKAIVIIFSATLILAAFCGCGRPHNAIKLPEPSPQILSDLEFFTYDELVTWIKSNPNLIHENVDTSKSSSIKSADYYYLDSKSGLLNLIFEDESVIFGGFPADRWLDFKKANDFDRFYNSSIKNVSFLIWIRESGN